MYTICYMKTKRRQYADDDHDSISNLMRLRFPSLFVGLAMGTLLSFITSNFEAVLAKNIQVAYFIPFVVYMADAVGTQTQAIYVRDLKSGKTSFRKYFIKETVLGIILGTIASCAVGILTFVWLMDVRLSLSIAIAMFLSIASAPLVALSVTEFFQLEHSDPAASSGPIATVIQDTLSVLIYGLVASWIIF